MRNWTVYSSATDPLIMKWFFDIFSSQKARVALPNVKPVPFGLPFSMADIRSSNLDEGITVMMHTITHRDSDQSWPVYLSNLYYYQLGPLNREPFTVNSGITDWFWSAQFNYFQLKN